MLPQYEAIEGHRGSQLCSDAAVPRGAGQTRACNQGSECLAHHHQASGRVPRHHQGSEEPARRNEGAEGLERAPVFIYEGRKIGHQSIRGPIIYSLLGLVTLYFLIIKTNPGGSRRQEANEARPLRTVRG